MEARSRDWRIERRGKKVEVRMPRTDKEDRGKRIKAKKYWSDSKGKKTEK